MEGGQRRTIVHVGESASWDSPVEDMRLSVTIRVARLTVSCFSKINEPIKLSVKRRLRIIVGGSLPCELVQRNKEDRAYYLSILRYAKLPIDFLFSQLARFVAIKITETMQLWQSIVVDVLVRLTATTP